MVSSGFNVEAMAVGSKSCYCFSGIFVRYAEVSFEARTLLYSPVELKLRRFISNYIPSMAKDLLLLVFDRSSTVRCVGADALTAGVAY